MAVLENRLQILKKDFSINSCWFEQIQKLLNLYQLNTDTLQDLMKQETDEDVEGIQCA